MRVHVNYVQTSPPAVEPEKRESAGGVDLRDLFAGMAMQAMNSNPELMQSVTSGSVLDGTYFDRLSKRAYEQADAMLKARESR